MRMTSVAVANKGNPANSGSSSPQKPNSRKDLLVASKQFTFAPPARVVHKEIDYSTTVPVAPRGTAQLNRTPEKGSSPESRLRATTPGNSPCKDQSPQHQPGSQHGKHALNGEANEACSSGKGCADFPTTL